MKKLPPGWTLKVARNGDEVEALGPYWKEVCRHPFCDPDTFTAIVKLRDEVIRPHVICLEKGGEPAALLAGRIENHPIELQVGYSILGRPKIRSLTLLHPGIMGDDSAENAAALLSAVDAALADGEAGAAFLSQQTIDSDLFRAACGRMPFIRRDAWYRHSLHWTGALGGTYEEYLKTRSSNTRGNLRRYSRKIEKEFPGDRSSVRVFRDPSGLDELVGATETIDDLTYHQYMTNGRRAREEKQALFRVGMEQGWLRACVLSVDEAPVAYWYGNVYKRTLFISATGFDPELAHLRPGTYLLVRMMREICDGGEADRVDFGWGDAQYKRTLADAVRTEASLLLFPFTPRGIFLALLKSGTNGLSAAADRILEKLNARGKVRKAWRERLVRQGR